MKLVKSAVLALGLCLVAQGATFAQEAKAPAAESIKEMAELSYAAQAKYALSDTRAIGVGLIIIGAGLGIGGLTKSAVESMARQPETATTIQTTMLIAAAMIEGATFFALLIVMLFVSPW